MNQSVITGGGSGIGRAIALNLAGRGDHTIILDYALGAGSRVVEEILAAGGSATAIECDVSSEESIESAFAQIDRIDTMVNNAGIAHIGNVEKTSSEDFDRVYQVNVKGVFLCLKQAVQKMRANGGSIVNMASIASKVGIQDRFAYSMSKGAVLTMTLSIARDYVEHGIRCNCICPARVHTPFVDGYLEKSYPAEERPTMFEKLSSYQPIGRMGQPEEIANLVRFLSSSEATFITGSAYDIDGGVTLLR
ncbi:MAG: SDR family NAD(P)-dependent oxidoreductase [Akkermansiaceae bacterium]